MDNYIELLKLTNEEVNKIKENSPESLPLNPTGQGYSAQEIRKKLYMSISGNEGSLLSILRDRMNVIGGMLQTIGDDLKDTITSVEFLVSEQVLVIDNEGNQSTVSLGVLESQDNPLITKAYLNYAFVLELAPKANKVILENNIEVDLVDVYNKALDLQEQIFFNDLDIQGIQKNKENVLNKAQDFTTVNETLYPSVQATKTELDKKENVLNKAQDFTTINETLYPSVQATKTELDKKVDKILTIIGLDLKNNIGLEEFKEALGNVTQIVAGLMSPEDKTHLDDIVALFNEDGDNIVNTIGEILAIFNNYPEGADLVTALNGKVDKVAGKQLSTNDLTDILKAYLLSAYGHSQTVDSNPHQTTYQQLRNKPTTIEGLGITNVYNKEYIDLLKDQNGWENELLTPLPLVPNGTISTATLLAYDSLKLQVKNLETSFVDTDSVQVSIGIVTGNKIQLSDTSVYLEIGATNSTFVAPSGWRLQIVGLKYTELKASDITYIPASSGMNATDVQEAIDELEVRADTLESKKANRYIDAPIAELNNHTLREVFESIVINPTFDNGSDDWLLTGSGSVSNGIYTFIVPYQGGNLRQIAPLSYQNDKLYLVSRFKANSDQVVLLSRGSSSNESLNQVAHSGSNNFEIKSMNWVNTTNQVARFSIVDNRSNDSNSFSNIEVDYIYVANQTALGISSLSVEQMDYWFNLYQQYKDDNDLKSLVEQKTDKLESRQVGETIITYQSGVIVSLSSDNVVEAIEYDVNGEVEKVTSTYADGKVYEETYTKDVNGNITKITKVEVI